MGVVAHAVSIPYIRQNVTSREDELQNRNGARVSMECPVGANSERMNADRGASRSCKQQETHG
ncbi:MAG: hypothetical protein CMM59_22440 [Rhodospirillaceae bacterium]|nr:hypothetical protein [Rhodospirillaceae bacterium]